jgi:phage-related protein
MPEFNESGLYEVLVESAADKWLSGLATSKDAKVVAVSAEFITVLTCFQEAGPLAGKEIGGITIKRLVDKIWELKENGGQHRLAFAWKNNQCIVLHGIRKKRGPWPKKDIDLVKKRWSQYQ